MDDDFLRLSIISLLGSRSTFLIVLSGLCILNEDFEAFKFEKKDLEGSRACLGVWPGELGKGGNEVNEAEMGDEGDPGGFAQIA